MLPFFICSMAAVESASETDMAVYLNPKPQQQSKPKAPQKRTWGFLWVFCWKKRYKHLGDELRERRW
jgi:hypothetical protein